MNKKTVASLAIIIILVLGGIWYYQTNKPTPATGEPFKIGALFPLTGGLASYGEPAQKVAALAEEEINARGGINGQPISVVFQDHQCKPSVAVSLFQKLSTVDNIHLFTSVACSGTVMSLAPILGNDNVLLGNTITAASISGVSPSVFRNYASDADTAKLFSDYILKVGAKRVSIIYEETDYAKGLKINVEKNLEGSDVKITSEGYVPDATDMRSQLTKLKASNPDLLFISPQTVTSADKVLKAMREISFRPTELIVNENIFRSAELNASYPDLLEGAISNDYRATNNSQAQKVLNAYKTKYGEDCPQKNICVGVYDNVYILAEAIGKVGYDATKVRDYLKQIRYSGASGEIYFNDKNDRDNAHFSLYVIRNQEGIEVK